MKKIVFLPMLILLTLFLTPLRADITATYDPDPYLFFTIGTDPFASTDFVAHLGTLTLTITGQLFNPSLVNLTIPNIFSFTGPVSTNPINGGPPYTQQTTEGARLCSVSTVKNKTTYSIIEPTGDTLPLSTANGNYNTSVFVAELYIYGSDKAWLYRPGAVYTIDQANFGSFNVAVGNNNSGTPGDYIPINGQDPPDPNDPTPPPPVPINPITPEPLPYIDPDEDITDAQYFLSIICETSFELQNALGVNSSPIAQAMVVLYQPIDPEDYGVAIHFSRQPGHSTFATLHPEGNLTGYAIPYQLEFLGEPVYENNPISWTSLSEGVNTQNIFITGISSAVAGGAPSGLYVDTIVVTIVPIDTV